MITKIYIIKRQASRIFERGAFFRLERSRLARKSTFKINSADIIKKGPFTYFQKGFKKRFTKLIGMDIITIESEIFQRRSKNMMVKRSVYTTVAAGTAMMKTVNLNITHSTRLEWIA